MSQVEQSLCLFPALGLVSGRPCWHLAHGMYSTNVNSYLRTVLSWSLHFFGRVVLEVWFLDLQQQHLKTG